MNLDTITLKLRPRNPYEAMDLGILLLQDNAWAVYGAWFAFVVPLMLALVSTVTIAAWLPLLLIWWLKPVYDRIVLLVLSRAVFGVDTGLGDIDWRAVLRSGLFGALTWRRLGLTRSFNLPVFLLEGLHGRERRERTAILHKNTRNQAVLLTVAYVHVEQVIQISLFVLAATMLPQYTSFPIFDWLTGDETPLGISILTAVFYIITLTIIEPVYTASGFTLYLNRRVELEAWDIEVDLRRAMHNAVGVVRT